MFLSVKILWPRNRRQKAAIADSARAMFRKRKMRSQQQKITSQLLIFEIYEDDGIDFLYFRRPNAVIGTTLKKTSFDKSIWRSLTDFKTIIKLLEGLRHWSTAPTHI